MDPKEKRKRVMARSIKLGHCVCDPRQPCPCTLFREKNICTCAGERVPPESTGGEVRLTDFVRSAGCASKISQKDLHQVLGMLPTVKDPRLLVGTATADDAGVFRLTPDVTIVQTVDVFTPGVDDPFTFGRIAACNSLSDVYAMGGKPITALSVIGFPIYSLPHEVMAEILKGGMAVLDEAGAILLGGHSINDEEIKFGFAVTGLIEKADLVTNAKAAVGDVLILTKPLGTGVISLANQLEKASPEAIEAIGRSMSTLNRVASEIMVRHGASACTDVTGFGLLGHLCQMVIESGVTADVWCDRLPLFPGVMEYAEQGMFSGANERNAEYSAKRSEFTGDVSEATRAILYDAQTSGGLLIALPEAAAAGAVAEMQAAGVESATIIGRVSGTSDGRIRIYPTAGGEGSGTRKHSEAQGPRNESRGMREHSEAHEVHRENTAMSDHSDQAKASAKECCTHGEETQEDAATLFRQFMGAALKPGAVDVVAKEMIAVALSLGVHCDPCSRHHIQKALDMGLGKQELEEIAAIAMGFGGCRSLMLWNELKEELLA